MDKPGSNRRLPNTKRKTKIQRHTASPVFEETLEYCLHESGDENISVAGNVFEKQQKCHKEKKY
jgi:hypothetical protein